MKLLHTIKLGLLLSLLLCSIDCFAADSTNLSAGIYTAISKDNKLTGVQVGITLNGSVAAISGRLDNADQVLELVSTVDSVPGISDVDISSVTVTSGPMPTYNDVISAKVKGAIVRQQVFGPTVTLAQLPISVKTNLGITYLFGTVDNHEQMKNSILVAQKVPGVQRVISELYIRHITVTVPN